MSKYVYKFIPCNKWQIGETESWLSHMAEEGLILKSLGSTFAKFEKKLPKKIRYRLDYYSTGSMPKNVIAAYAESGWSYCCYSGKFHIFSAPEDSSIPELHTDTTEQGYSLNTLNKHLFKNCIFTIIWFLLMLYLVYTTLFFNDTFYLNLVQFGFNTSLILMPVYIMFVYIAIFEYISISKLKKSLIEGKPINHRAPWKNTEKLTPKVDFFIRLFLSVLVLTLLLITTINSTNIKPIPEAASTLPIIMLNEVEETPYIDWYNPLLTETEASHWYIRDWSPLGPIAYQSYETGVVQELSAQTGKVTNKSTTTGAPVYEPTLKNEVYKVRFANMADNVLYDLINARIPFDDDIETSNYMVNKIDNNTFDLLYVSQDKTKFFASRGKGVIYINYSGEASFDRILELISEKLKLIE